MEERRIEVAMFTSTSGSNRKSISRSSPGEEENYGRILAMLESVYENLGSSGDARLADGCCSSGVEPNANYYWSCKKIVPTKHEHQSDTSRQLDNSSLLAVKEKRRLKWHQIRLELERQSRLNEVEEAEVVADQMPKRTKIGKSSDISYPVYKKDEQRRNATNNQFPAYQNEVSPSRISPLRDEHRSINPTQIHGLEATKLVAEGSSQKTKLAATSHISPSAPQKQMRRSTFLNQFQSRQPKGLCDRSLRYPPLCNEANEPKEDRPLSRDNIAERKFTGPLQRKTHEARRPIHNTVGETENERVKEESLVAPTRSYVNEEVSVQTHEASRTMLNTVRERDKENATKDPIWRGRLDIINKRDNTFEGFVAHLSRSACQPAIEEARLLPALLQLEMVPKSTVWPKSFHMTRPIDYHIALYILPADKRYEKKFDLLVDNMSKRGLAMRTFTKNAELLIFASTELEMPYWRFRNKYYIWGVFRGRIRTSSDI